MRKRKKKIEKRKIVLITLFIVCLILGYIANVTSTTRQLTVFEKALKDGILTVQNIMTYPIDFVFEKIKMNKEKNKMYDEYNLLKEELEKSQKYINENEELIKQLNEMKEVLQLNNSLQEHISINATIIGRDLAYWNENIIIDKGESSGITINMPVVVKDGLIGKVVKTTAYTSTVKLLTSTNNDKISVKIKNKDEYIYGILSKYDKINDIYIIEGISQNIEIVENSIVTTTGMGDIYPAGIVIGTIKGITTDNFDLSKVLQMKSNVNFDSINYVTVLKRKDL